MRISGPVSAVGTVGRTKQCPEFVRRNAPTTLPYKSAARRAEPATTSSRPSRTSARTVWRNAAYAAASVTLRRLASTFGLTGM